MCWRCCSDGWAASPEASGTMDQGWTHTMMRAPPGDIAAGGGTSLYNPTGGVWRRSRGHRLVSAMGQHYLPARWEGAASWLKAQALQLRGALHPVLHPATQCHLWLCRRLLRPSSVFRSTSTETACWWRFGRLTCTFRGRSLEQECKCFAQALLHWPCSVAMESWCEAVLKTPAALCASPSGKQG